jgi:hypothetical protein
MAVRAVEMNPLSSVRRYQFWCGLSSLGGASHPATRNTRFKASALTSASVITLTLRSLGRYGACCARDLWKFYGLFTASSRQGGAAPGRGEQGRSHSNVRRRPGTRTPSSPPVRLPPRATWRSQGRAYGASPGQEPSVATLTPTARISIFPSGN